MSLRTRRWPLRPVLLLTLPAALLLAVLVMSAEPAAAHARVVTTDPADGSTMPVAPTRVSITFSEPVSINAGGVTVRNAAGERVDDGTPTVRGTEVTVPLRPGLVDGSYVTSWRVLSTDGHPVNGSIVFGIGSGAVDRSIGGTSDDARWEVLAALARIVLTISALVAAGVAFFIRYVHDGAEDRWTLLPIVRIGTMVALLAGIGAVIVQSALLTGEGAGAATDVSVLRTVLADDLGLSLGVLTLGLIAVHVSTMVGSTVVGRVLALYGGLAVTISFALWGHATAFDPVWLAMSSDAVHATAAAVWAGGVIGLFVVLHARRADATASAAVIVGRFSALALWTVVALVLAGLALATLGTDRSFAALTSTTWGRLVLLKSAITAIVLVLAAWNRRVLVPSFTTVPPTADTESAGRRLRRTVGAEALVILGVLVVTGVLTGITPARDAATRPEVQIVQEKVDTGTVRVMVRPARVGANTIEIDYLDPTGQPVDVGKTMTVEFSLRSADVTGLVVEVPARSPGRFVLDERDLTPAGTWTMTLVVRTGDFTEQRSILEIEIRP